MKPIYYLLKTKGRHKDLSVLHALDVSMNQRYSSGKKVIIKTTKERIQKKINEGISRDEIFPPLIATKLTHKKAVRLMQKAQWRNE